MEGLERDLLATLKRIDMELDDFTMECIDAGSDAAERAAWRDALQRAQVQVAQVKKEVQGALVKARRQWKTHARDALWSDMAESKEERERRQENALTDRSSEDKLMTASGDVTSALQRAVTMMSIELEKSSYSSQLLDESSMSIQQATLEYTSFTSLVSSSTKLIKSMERADFYDAIMLSLSFLFFVFCIAYIVKVRVWDRGMGLLSFIVRMGGLGYGSSAGANVKEKLLMAKQAAAKELEASKSALSAKATLVNTVASVASASIASVASAASAASLASSASSASVASAASVASVDSSISAASSHAAQREVQSPIAVDLEDNAEESITLLPPVATQEHAVIHDEL